MSSNEPPTEPPESSGGTPPPSPPPPPPSYGAPPPPSTPVPPNVPPTPPPYVPPPPGYQSTPPGAPPGGPAQAPWDLGAALSYGWQKFQANLAQALLAMLVLLVALAIAFAAVLALQGLLLSEPSTEVDPATGLPRTTGAPGLLTVLLVNGLMGAVIYVVFQVLGAGLIRGALGVTEGRPFRAADVFRPERLGAVLVTSLLVAAGYFVGLLLCYLPGLVWAAVTSFSLYFVIDRGLAPVDAIKASFRLWKENLGNALLWTLVGGLVATAGALACGIGMFVTAPIVLFGTAYTYKRLTGQPVAA